MARSKDRNEVVMSFACRQMAAQVVVYVARLIGGCSWAEKYIPEIMMRAEPEPIMDYLKEHGHGLVQPPEA